MEKTFKRFECPPIDEDSRLARLAERKRREAQKAATASDEQAVLVTAEGSLPVYMWECDLGPYYK